MPDCAVRLQLTNRVEATNVGGYSSRAVATSGSQNIAVSHLSRTIPSCTQATENSRNARAHSKEAASDKKELEDVCGGGFRTGGTVRVHGSLWAQ